MLEQAPEADPGEKQQLADLFNQLQAVGAKVTAVAANFSAKQAGAAAASTAAVAHNAPAAPKTGDAPPATDNRVLHSACPAADAGTTWANVVAKAPATGAPTTPQKQTKPAEGSTGGTGKTPLTLDMVLAADLTRGLRAATKESAAPEPGCKRSRANREADEEDDMSEGEQDSTH